MCDVYVPILLLTLDIDRAQNSGRVQKTEMCVPLCIWEKGLVGVGAGGKKTKSYFSQ